MDADRDALPDDINALKEALAAERAQALEIAAELAVALQPRKFNKVLSRQYGSY